MSSIHISIIIPTYNSAQCLAKCLNSIADQSYIYYEVILIDAVSNDETVSIAANYKSRIPDMYILSEPDKGIYDAMNKGIRLAKNPWIYFLGSDDELKDKDVLLDIAKCISGEVDMLYGDVVIKGNAPWAKDGDVYDGAFDTHKLANKNISHQAIFYKKTIFEKYGFYDVRYRILSDWEFNMRVFKKVAILYHSRQIAIFNTEGESTQKNLVDPFLNVRHWYAYKYLHQSIFSSYYRAHYNELLPLIPQFIQKRYYHLVGIAWVCFYTYRIWSKIKGKN